MNLIQDEKLRAKVKAFFERALTQMDLEKECLSFKNSPAGKSHHHSYRGGLLQHTIATTKFSLMITDLAEKIYGWKGIDRDYVIAGALLHDLFKPSTYIEKENGTYGYSPMGERLDHLSLLIGEAYKEGLPLELMHILAAHHGDAGPIYPRTVEALIVHLSDLIDSRLNGDVQRAAQFIIRNCVGEESGILPSKQAFRIVNAKKTSGCEGVKKVYSKMKNK
jgi:7,8-dihydroneopterin 2',3'-cyclic phosphate phosphodiesterase